MIDLNKIKSMSQLLQSAPKRFRCSYADLLEREDIYAALILKNRYQDAVAYIDIDGNIIYSNYFPPGFLPVKIKKIKILKKF